jgi:chemotaxis protein MotB
MVTIRRNDFWIEVEMRTDILFPSGSARLADDAATVIERLGTVLAPFPNPIRVEGYTDNKPIKTAVFYSNWELSAARAGSVVRVLATHGVSPDRLAVIGYGEQRPLKANDTPEGRNANRRVVIVILSTDLMRQPASNDPAAGSAGVAPTATDTAGVAPTGAAAPDAGSAANAAATDSPPVPLAAPGELATPPAATTTARASAATPAPVGASPASTHVTPIAATPTAPALQQNTGTESAP